MRKFKTKKTRKIKFKTYIIIILISFCFSMFIFNKANTDNIIESSINNLTNNINKSLKKVFNKLYTPEDVLYASLNKNVKKEDLSAFKITEDNYNYENDNTSYVEDPNPVKVKEPIVYLYNSHQLEEYAGVLVNDYNIRPNVLMASYILKEKLNEQDIPTIVETANIKEYLDKNKLKYKYSYNASKHFMKIAKTKNKSLNYFIDLHRDSVKKNLTTLTYKNKKYAKVMFIIGADHDNYKQNLKLAENINNALTLKIPGISRGVLKKSGRNVNGIYNQDFNPNTILIELGGIDNTIEEVNNTMEALAVVLSNYIKNKEESL